MNEQKRRILQAKVSLTLLDELGRRPTEQEVEKYTLAARVLYKTVLGLHFERKQQKRDCQLAIF